MNANRVVQIFLGDSLEEGHCKALGDLAGVRAKVVEPNDLVIFSFVADNLGIGVLTALEVHIPLQRFVHAAVSDDVILSELFNCLFLGVPAATVLNRSEHSCSNQLIAHLASALVEKTGS